MFKKQPKNLKDFLLDGEAYCSALSKSFGLNCIVLHLSNVYGLMSSNKCSVVAKFRIRMAELKTRPSDQDVTKFINQILNGEGLVIYRNEKKTRDFVFAKDICKGIFLSLISDITGFELFQLGTGIETSINSLILNITDIIDKLSIEISDVKYVEARQGEILKNFSDISKARN
ncbi:MAG: NAD-dependent epimerase/dehydratase family protein [Candidatus Thorarchaeota archaeon]